MDVRDHKEAYLRGFANAARAIASAGWRTRALGADLDDQLGPGAECVRRIADSIAIDPNSPMWAWDAGSRAGFLSAVGG